MTSKRSYWVKWLENTKRRGWTYLLCAAVMLMWGPVFLAIDLTGICNSGTLAAQEAEELGLRLRSAFVAHIGFSEVWALFALLFGVLFAVQGFCWLYSRHKMDLYMSVPVSSVKRYVMIWGSGILWYAGMTLAGILLCWAVGAAFGVMSCYAAAQSMAAWGFHMLAFLAIYHVSLVAVMLTGNVLTALLGCTVLFAYEPALRALYDSLKTIFYHSYCSADAERMMDLPWISPFAGALDLFGCVRYEDGYLVGPAGKQGLTWRFGMQAGLLIVCVVSAGIFAYWLYRKRKTESYHRSVAFQPLAAVLEAALLVPFSMAAGMIAAKTSGDRGLFLFGGCVLGAVCGHIAIRLVYKRELKAVIGGRAVFAGSLLAALCFLGMFRFDWTGYDRFVPAAQEVRAVSVSLESDYSAFGNYDEPFTGESSAGLVDKILESMNSECPETIESVIGLAGKWQDEGMPGAETGVFGNITVRYDSEAPEEKQELARWVACYTMQNGRKVYRRFFVDMEESREAVDTILRDPAYQKARYQIFSDLFAEKLGEMKVSFSDGRMETLYTAEKEPLLEALRRDFKGYDYSLMSQNLPAGRVSFELKNGTEEGKNPYTWEFPVYAEFEETVAVLEQNGIGVRDWQTLYGADEVAEIRIGYYHYEGRNDVILQEENLPEQQIMAVFTEKEQIGRLLKALYSEELSWIAGEEFDAVDRDERYTVQVILSEEGRKAREKEPDLCLIRRLEPEFLERAIREKAVYE